MFYDYLAGTVKFSSGNIQDPEELLCEIPLIWIAVDKVRTTSILQGAIFSQKQAMLWARNASLASIEEEVHELGCP